MPKGSNTSRGSRTHPSEELGRTSLALLGVCAGRLRPAQPFNPSAPSQRPRRNIFFITSFTKPNLQKTTMANDIYDMFGLDPLPKLTEAEQRLSPLFDALAYASESDDYFRESVALLRTINNHRDEIIFRLKSYLRYVKDNSLRSDIEQFLQSLGGAA